MAGIACNSGYSELAKLGCGEAADAFTYIAIGTGTGQGASHTALDTETTSTGLTRVAADTCHTVTTTVANDTIELEHTFTAGAGVDETITEALVGNNDTKDAGDALMLGDLSPTAPMVEDDTLTITAQCQLKAA